MSGPIRTRIGQTRRRLRLHLATVKTTLSTESYDHSLLGETNNDDLLEDTHLLLEIRTPFVKTYRSLLKDHEDFEKLRSASESEETEYSRYITTYGDYTLELKDASDTLVKLDSILDKFASECHARNLPLADDDALTTTTAKSTPPRKVNNVTQELPSSQVLNHRSEDLRIDYIAASSKLRDDLPPPPSIEQQPLTYVNNNSTSAFVTAALVGKSLPHFSGDLLEWPEFIESFNSLVRNGNISGADKLSLLKLCLSGEAQEIIEGLPRLDRNYEHALVLLTQEYDRPHHRHHALLSRLRNLPQCDRDGKNLRPFYLRLNVLVRQLLPNGELDSPDLLVNMITAKLPIGMQVQIMKESSRKAKFGVFDLLSILADAVEVEKIENEIIASTHFNTVTTMLDETPQQNQQTHSPTHHHSQPPHRYYQDQQVICKLCAGSHTEELCTTYTTPQDRSTAVIQRDLCENCLRPNHKTIDCRSRFRCRNCKEAHHTSTCSKSHSTPTTPLSFFNSKPSPNVTLHVTSTPDNEITQDSPQDFHQSPLLCLEVNVASPEEPEMTIPVTLVIDTGSNSSYIDEQLATDLHLPIEEEVSRSTYVFNDPVPRKQLSSLHSLLITLSDGYQEEIHLCSANHMTPSIDWVDKKNGFITPRRSKPQILLGTNFTRRYIFTPSLRTESFHNHSILHTDLGPCITVDSLPSLPPERAINNLTISMDSYISRSPNCSAEDSFRHLHSPPHQHRSLKSPSPPPPSLHSRSFVSQWPTVYIDRSLTWNDVYPGLIDSEDEDNPPANDDSLRLLLPLPGG